MRRCRSCDDKHADYVGNLGHLAMDATTGATVLVPHDAPITWARATSDELATFRQRIASDWHADSVRANDITAKRVYIEAAMRDLPDARASYSYERTGGKLAGGIGSSDVSPVNVRASSLESLPDGDTLSTSSGLLHIAPAGAWWAYALRQSASRRRYLAWMTSPLPTGESIEGIHGVRETDEPALCGCGRGYAGHDASHAALEARA